MRPEDVGRSYDALAERWSGDRFPSDDAVDAHQRAIAFVDNRERALDIGCGSSGRILDLLLAAGFEPEGLDVSRHLEYDQYPELHLYVIAQKAD